MLFLTAGILSWGYPMHLETEASPPGDLEILPVDHLPEYVIGFPMHVAITVRGRSGVFFNALPFADFLDLHACVGAEIVGPDNAPVRYLPKPRLDQQSGKRGGKLAPGESRRMLADVSPYFLNAVPGDYRARFSYVDTDARYPAPPVTLRLRRPTPAESALLASAAADRPKFATWGLWTTTCPQTLFEKPIGPENPARFNLIVRKLLCGPAPLDKADPAILDVLTGLYAPEAHALQAELYQARGDGSHYQNLRSEILREAPGLEWWMRMIDGGGAYLKSLRFLP